ncbi:MAG: hypothetical protein QNJ98_14960 [Planctomycetota bacterium]|nr:hypothetical protein [Planctomycetota bacterium]
MTSPALETLEALESVARTFGPEAAAAKPPYLAALERAELPDADAVYRLHEVLCFLRAHPDDAALLELVERMLGAFAKRKDLRRHRRELVNTGIAGTAVHFPFDAFTARWLAKRWPANLKIDWRAVGNKDRLMDRVYMLALDAETPALDHAKLSPRKWIERMKRPDETDAAYVINRFAKLPWEPTMRNVIYDELELPLVLKAGDDTPSRTAARMPGGRVTWQAAPLRRQRPDVRKALAEPPRSIRKVPRKVGQQLIDLTNAAMVTRERYLDAFNDADPDDVRMVDCGDGLEFAVIGVRPTSRMMIETVYAWLTLRNRVPVGYVLVSALFGSSEIAFNTFDTWRGGDAGWVYGRVLSTTKALFGSDTFTVFPYQLGHKNREGLESGAWWFYQKLGFRPRDPEVVALMESELAKIQRKRSHRSSIATLKQLARVPMYYATGRERSDVIGQLKLDGIGLAVTDYVATRFGSDRGRAEKVCAAEAAALLGAKDWRGWPAGERLMWLRYAPLLMAVPEIADWRRADQRALVRLVRAKGGPRESDYAKLLDAHKPWRKVLRRLASPK